MNALYVILALAAALLVAQAIVVYYRRAGAREACDRRAAKHYAAELHAIAAEIHAPPPAPAVAVVAVPDLEIRDEDTGPIVAGWWNEPPLDHEPAPLYAATGELPVMDEVEGFTVGWNRADLLERIERAGGGRG